MTLIKSYLICCAAIITISMGADNWIELVRPRTTRKDIAIVKGRVQFWGGVLSTETHTLFEEKSLTLVPGCTLSFEENVFTFNSRFKAADSWSYLDSSSSSSSSSSTTEVCKTRTAVNEKIQMLSIDHLQDTMYREYLVWKVHCPAGLAGIVGRKFREFSDQVRSITITAPNHEATKEEASHYIPGRKPKPRAVCEMPIAPPKPAVVEPPDTVAIVQGLSKAYGARGKRESWMNTYWDKFSTFLDQSDVPEISHFLKPMIILRKQWNERKNPVISHHRYHITPTDAKKRMTEIYEGSIRQDGIHHADSFPVNIAAAVRLKLTEWATKTYDGTSRPWCNRYGELHIVPTGIEWTDAITSLFKLLKENPHIEEAWRNSDAYQNWLATSYGEKYREWKFSHDREKADSKLIKKKKTATASASASSTTHSTAIPPPPPMSGKYKFGTAIPPPPMSGKYKVGSTLISQKGPSTYKPPPPEPKSATGMLALMSRIEKKEKKSKALESYYNNIYNDWGYYGYDGFDERYSENDVSAAYLRGYVNGLLSRLNQRNQA